MEILLNSAGRKRLVIAVAAALCLIYLFWAGRLLVASFFGERPELASLQRAARLDPWNADYRNHLGRYYALVARDPGAAIEPYRAAVQLDPHSARYWFDLASAYQVLGDVSSQTMALERAIEADPTTPDVAWEAANFYLVQGEEAKALREFRVVLENEPTLADPAIQFCWRINPDVDALLRNVVPARSEAYLAFLNLLMQKQETAATAKVWAALVSSQQTFELRYVYEYLQYLFNHKDVDQARLVWQQAAPRFGLSAYLPSGRNLIVNGDFGLDVLNGGLAQSFFRAACPSERGDSGLPPAARSQFPAPGSPRATARSGLRMHRGQILQDFRIRFGLFCHDGPTSAKSTHSGPTIADQAQTPPLRRSRRQCG